MATRARRQTRHRFDRAGWPPRDHNDTVRRRKAGKSIDRAHQEYLRAARRAVRAFDAAAQRFEKGFSDAVGEYLTVEQLAQDLRSASIAKRIHEHATGRLICSNCAHIQTFDYAATLTYLRNGWPTHCGTTMYAETREATP